MVKKTETGLRCELCGNFSTVGISFSHELSWLIAHILEKHTASFVEVSEKAREC